MLGDVARGDDPSGGRQALRSAPTVATLFDRFLDEYVDQHCKPTTARDYRSVVRRFIRPKLGPLRVADVTRTDIIAFHHALRETPYQANRTASMLSKLFNLAEDWGLRQSGPTLPAGSRKTAMRKRNGICLTTSKSASVMSCRTRWRMAQSPSMPFRLFCY